MICHKSVIQLSQICHTYVLHLSYSCDTSAIQLSYICHTYVINLSNICQTSVKHPSNICQTSVKHLSNICSISVLPGDVTDWLEQLATMPGGATGRLADTYIKAYWHSGRYLKLALAYTNILAYWHSGRYLQLTTGRYLQLAQWQSPKTGTGRYQHTGILAECQMSTTGTVADTYIMALADTYIHRAAFDVMSGFHVTNKASHSS